MHRSTDMLTSKESRDDLPRHIMIYQFTLCEYHNHVFVCDYVMIMQRSIVLRLLEEAGNMSSVLD